MVLKRFYDEGLAQASYLVGCPEAGVGAVIDPNRNFRVYLEAAEAEGMRIAAVTETHIHADYLSGARELARLTGAQLYLSGEGGTDWQYGFAAADGARLLHDGDAFNVGPIRLQAIHTPGHTPEHLTFIVTDESSTDVPMGAFTGDFIFVGDVGRPDLLERAAKQAGTMAKGAQDLFQSLRQFESLLPEFALLFPGHGAGSACGKALGGVPVTTLGYERASSWAFRIPDSAAFVQEVLAGQPDPPAYFAVMKRMNRDGPRLIGEDSPLPEFDAQTLFQVEADTLLLDVRPGQEFAEGHFPGSLNVPVSKDSFTTHAGSILPYDRPLTLVAANRAQAEAARGKLRLIGLDDVRGWLLPDAALATASFTEIEPREAWDARCCGEATLLDVRNPNEWHEGHAPGAQHIPLRRLTERAGEIDRSKPVAIYCHSGSRSMIACSVLARLGFSVANLEGGFENYESQGLPTEAEGATPVA